MSCCTDVITVELGRENETYITLGRRSTCAVPCETIPPESITRAVLRIGDIVLDTMDDTLAFNTDRTGLIAQLGLLDLQPDQLYAGNITLYDELAHEGGLAWARVILSVIPWPGPETE
jgi:hypothetical protein